MKKIFSILALSSIAAHAGNFECPMSNRGSDLESLLGDARASLTTLKTQQDSCRRGLEAADGPGDADATLTNAITQLGNIPTRCETPAGQAQQRYARLLRVMETLRATDAPADDANISSRPGNWKMFDSYLPNLPELGSYRQCTEQSQNNGLTRFYVDLTCVQVSDDLTVASATNAPSSGSFGSAAPGCGGRQGLSPQVTQAIQAAIETAISMTESSQCAAAPRAAVSAVNLVTSLAMATPLSPLLGVALAAGQRLFTGIFTRHLDTANRALNRDTEEIAETQAQCMYMNLQKAALGCNNSDSNITQLQRRVTEKNTLAAQLEQEVAGYRSAYNNSNPEEDYGTCTRRSGNTNSRRNLENMVSGWNLSSVENLFSPPPVIPQATAPVVVTLSGSVPVAAPFEPSRDALTQALISTCDLYKSDSEAVANVTQIASTLESLGQMCQRLDEGTFPSVDEMRNVFLRDSVKLSTRLSVVIRRVPETSQTPEELLAECLRNLPMNENNVRRDKIVRIRDLRGRLSTFSGVEEELAEARNAQMQSQLTASGSRFWGNYHTAWQGRNGTQLRIGDLLQQRAETGNPTNLRVACESGDQRAITQSANEVHAICLLNAGVYLHQNNAQQDLNGNLSQDWQRICRHFLENPEFAPPLPITSANYSSWQCDAFQKFEDYRANFLSQPSRIRDVCQTFSSDRRRQPSSRIIGQ